MSSFKIYNATELWQRETCLPSIPSFSLSLDNVLGNDGLRLGSITELVGLPGSGKTQLCLQFCASVQIPKVLGGLSAEALYIDTNTNFSIYRFKEILYASLSKCQSLLNTHIAIQEEDALKKLHYVNAFGLEKFCACIHNVPKLVQEHPNVKLIVIDSITFPFKEGISPNKRTGLLFRLMAELHRTAFENQIAVLVTNEMSTRVGLRGGASVGALGDAWAHRCAPRLLLAADTATQTHNLDVAPQAHNLADAPLAHNLDVAHQAHVAVALKAHQAPAAVGRFKITEEGIRDVE